MTEIIGKGILQVGFDAAQVKQAGETQLLPAANELARGVGGAFAAIKIAGFAKDGIDELKQAGTVSAQTGAQIKITGGAAGITAKQVDDLGQSMLNLAGFDDEAGRSAANVLLRFDAIRGSGTFTRVEKDAADLAITMGTDLPSAADLLGKAMQNPDKAMRLLRPVIGQLSDAQQANIRDFLAQNDVASAQGVILTALESKIGGTAKAFGDTLAGGQAKAAEESKNMKAALVEGLAPGLAFVDDRIIDLAHGIEGLPGPLRAVGGAAVLAGSETLALAQPVAALTQIYGRWKDAQEATAAASKAVAAAAAEQRAVTFSNSGALAAEAAATEAAASAAAADAVAQEELNAAFLRSGLFAAAAADGAIEVATAETLLATNSAAAVGSLYEVSAAEATAGLGMTAMAAAVALPVAAVVGLGIATGQFGDTLDIVNPKLDGFKTNLADAFDADKLAVDVNLFKSVTDALKDDKLSAAFSHAGISVNDFTTALRTGNQAFFDHLKGSNDDRFAIDALAVATANASRAALDRLVAEGRLSQAQEDQALQGRNAVQALDLLVSSGQVAASVQTDVAASLDGTGTSATSAADALTKLSAAQADQITGARAAFDASQSFASAQKGVESALKGVEDAERRVTDAQLALNQARQHASSSDLAHGTLDIESAHLRVADSAQAVTDAQAALDLLRRQNRSTPDELAAAERRVEEANIAHQEAILGVSDAEKRQQDLQKKGTDQDQAVITAKQNLASAQDAEKTAVDNLGTAYGQQADAAAKLKDEQYKLAGGLDIQSQAVKDQIDAYYNLAATLDPSSTYFKNVQNYIALLQGAQDKFAGQTGFQDESTPQSFAHSNARAAGGYVGPGETFRGAEQGFEILWKDSMYKAPPAGGYVMDHADSLALMQAARGGSSDNGVHIGQVIVQGDNAPDALKRLPGTLRQSVTLARR